MTMLPCRAAELLAGWSLVSYNASYSWDFQDWKASASFMTRRKPSDSKPNLAIHINQQARSVAFIGHLKSPDRRGLACKSP